MEVVNWFFGLPIVNQVFGAVVGAVVSVLVSRHYAKRSSEELKSETYRLRRLISELAYLMKTEGLIDAEFDEAGNLKRIIRLSGTSTGRSSARGTLTGGSPPGDPPDQPPDPSNPGA
jgi:hypothetical protein